MATGKEQRRKLTITISSGSGTGSITSEWTLARWIRIVPVSESDTFTVNAKDGDGFIMFSRTGQTGTLSENLMMSLGILKTIEISSASQDGDYTVLFDLH